MIKDNLLYSLIEKEENRQLSTINLIASENRCLEEIQSLLNTSFGNKYAEGFPGKRYYGGCEFIDQVEELCQERCKDLFNAEYANVQPHAGVEANLIAYKAFLKPGDMLFSMDLSSGGHLSHSHKKHLISDLYNIQSYGVDPKTYLIDYDFLRKRALELKPKIILAGASAYSRLIEYQKIRSICDEIGAIFMVDMAHIAGLVAAKCIPSPVETADIVTFTTHKTLRGPRGGCIIAKKEHQKKIEQATIPGLQGGPFMHVILAKALLFSLAKEKFYIEYQNRVIENARVLSSELIDFGFNVLTGGTDNHMILVDLRNKKITGKAAEKILGENEIIVNRNMIPYDTESSLITSGIRLGTAFETSKGAKKEEIRIIAKKINDIISNY